MKRFSWLWAIFFWGVIGCTPVESEPLMVTRPPRTVTPVVTATAMPSPTVTGFPPTTTPPSTPAPDATPTPISHPQMSVAESSTRLYMPTVTPYPFERTAACFPPDEHPENYPPDYKDYWKACTDLLYSPDEEWIAVLVGPDFCGFNVGLYHRPTGEFTIYGYGGAKYYEFLSDNRLLIEWGSCSNSVMDILDPVSGEVQRLGEGFRPHAWNEARTAFISINGGWTPIDYFSVYSVETNRDLTRGPLAPNGLVFWSEDPDYILYEVSHYTVHYTPDNNEEYQMGPRQVYRVSLERRATNLIIDDPAHSYYLIECPKNEAGTCDWPQDWIRVYRVPYVEEDFYQWASNEETNWDCIGSGRGCSEPDEVIWLNWRTGEIETESASSISPSSTPTLPGS